MFDNIPLTALALKQGGYDWGFLAYAVGFGGSMIWFGSSAGVALANLYPGGEVRRASGCATAGTSRWPTSIGFFVMLGGARLASGRSAHKARRRARRCGGPVRRLPFHIVKSPCGARESEG